jgi:hypothetical protein
MKTVHQKKKLSTERENFSKDLFSSLFSCFWDIVASCLAYAKNIYASASSFCSLSAFFSDQNVLGFETKARLFPNTAESNRTVDLLKNLFPDIKVLNITMSPPKGWRSMVNQR